MARLPRRGPKTEEWLFCTTSLSVCVALVAGGGAKVASSLKSQRWTSIGDSSVSIKLLIHTAAEARQGQHRQHCLCILISLQVGLSASHPGTCTFTCSHGKSDCPPSSKGVKPMGLVRILPGKWRWLFSPDSLPSLPCTENNNTPKTSRLNRFDLPKNHAPSRPRKECPPSLRTDSASSAF